MSHYGIRLFAAIGAYLWASLVLAVPTTYSPGALTFSTSDQSMWGAGSAFQLDETYFFGGTWNESQSFGGVGNLPGTGGTITNPAYTAWTVALAGCQALGFSRSTCIDGAIGLPGIGDAPAQTIANPVPAVLVGLEATLSTNGRVGFEFGVTIDSGSLDATVAFDNVTATVPDAIEAAAVGGLVSLNPMADLIGEDLSSQFPTITLTSGLVFDVFAGVSGQACIGACVPFNASMDVDPDLPIVSFNVDGEGGIEWFGGDPLIDAVLNAGGASLPTGLPALDVPLAGGLFETDLFFPQPNATYDGTDGTALFASGQDDLINLTLDVDNVVSLIATQGLTQNLYGGSIDLGFGSASWDFVDIDMGPAIDLRQEFELTPTLMVDLEFSQPVTYLDQVVSFIGGLEWGAIPDLLFSLGDTLVTPTFYLQYGAERNAVELFNQLLLDVNGLLEIDLLSFAATIGKDLGILGDYSLTRSWSLGSIAPEFDIGQIPFFDVTFAMGGFNDLLASSFVVSIGGDAVSVPEPGSLALLLLGLVLVLTSARPRMSS